MKIYTKESLISELTDIAARGWINNARHGNHGGIGNTLEDLLEIEENNLPIPNAAEWELKAQRINTSALCTLIHIEPSPRAIKFVPQVLLPKYGWAHKEAGNKYGPTELSFRQTIHGLTHSDRGFIVQIDRKAKKVLVSFDSSKVLPRHKTWVQTVQNKAGLAELNPQPYWGFDDLEHHAGTKLLNSFYVQAQVRRVNGKEQYWYREVMMLQGFDFGGFLTGLEQGNILVDFDARTGHNHGTKFRRRQNFLPQLYSKVTRIISNGQLVKL